jgi:hypothetical protein
MRRGPSFVIMGMMVAIQVRGGIACGIATQAGPEYVI